MNKYFSKTKFIYTFVSFQGYRQSCMNGCVPLINGEMDRICTPIKQNLKHFKLTLLYSSKDGQLPFYNQ